MPFISIKVLKGSLSLEKKKEMITKVSEAVAEVEASPHPKEKLLPSVWCQIEEMEDGNFGVGGQTVTLDMLKAKLNG